MEDSSPHPIDLDPNEYARLVGRYGRRFAAGEALFREGDPANEAFLLQEGRIRLLKRVRTVERSLIVLKPGDLFGESALIDSAARNSTAVALSDGTALVLDRTTFRPLLEHYPSIAIRLLEQLTRRVRDAEDQIEIMMVKDTQSKIVTALLKLVQRSAGTAEITISPVELSTRVGLDVETVKRGVQRLREQQYVRIVDERVEIPDVEALRRLYALLGTKEDLRGEQPPGR
jgi:CRP/FNR family transcriptional regulator, cyclic AMP receptor protein